MSQWFATSDFSPLDYDETDTSSVVIGREISIVSENGDIRAAALDICDDGALLVRTEEGYTRRLCGGEITIRLKK